MAAESRDLQGKVYVDARGIPLSSQSEAHGYGGYDESMREMAKLLGDVGKLPVTLDDKPELFAPQSCPNCLLYCGWYSLANYIDCFQFVPGAVAWHLASSEAVTLHDAGSKLWCKNLLEHGAAATLWPGCGTLHHWLSETRRILRHACVRRLHACRNVLAHRAVGKLDDGSDRRPAL